MLKIQLRHLEHFIAVAEELSFCRAAQRLHLSQPPITRNIKQLEAMLGVDLFTRSTRHVQLTHAGASFLTEARATLGQLSKAVEIARIAAREQVGALTLGYEASSVYDAFPQALKVFRNRFPNVELSLKQMDTHHQAEALKSYRIDFGFLVPPIRDDELSSEIVFREPLVLAATASHPLATRRMVELAMLAGEPFILSSPNQRCGLYDQVIRVCSASGFSPRVVQEANEMQIMLGFVATGLGITLLPAHVAELHRPGIVFRPLLPRATSVEVALAWHRDRSSPIMSAFADVVKACTSQSGKPTLSRRAAPQRSS